MYTMPEIKYRLNNYYKFLVVRDPLERLVSAYLDKFGNKDEEFLTIYGKRANIMRSTGRMTHNSPLNSSVSFSNLVDIIIEQNHYGLLLNQHWDTYENLCETCKIKYDYVAKFETYRSDFQHLLKRICHGSKCDTYATEKNEAKTAFNDINNFYAQLSANQLAAIREIYHRDMNTFGYKFRVPMFNFG